MWHRWYHWRSNHWPQPQVWEIPDQMWRESDQAQQKEIATANHGSHLYGTLSHKQGVTGRPWEDQSDCQHAQARECEGSEAILWVRQLSHEILSHLANEMEPLRQLTHKDVPWRWQPEHDTAFEKIKTMVTMTRYCDIMTLQRNWPSRLTQARKDWVRQLCRTASPLHKPVEHWPRPSINMRKLRRIEMLAVVFALQKFDQYVYGRTVTIQSDHKPLEATAKKPFAHSTQATTGNAAKDPEVHVWYQYHLPSRSRNVLADTLS